jgi:addiction module HigA family antidote
LKPLREVEKDNTVFVSATNGEFAFVGIPTALLMLKLWITTEGIEMRQVAAVTPGEMLEQEFLKPLGLSKYKLAKDLGIPAQRIGDIVAGKRAITADTDLRLCRYFGLSDGWWLRGQGNYDIAIAREKMGEALEKIQRCTLLAA